MPRLIGGEFHKLFTTRLWLWLLLACAGLTGLFAILDIAFGGGTVATPPLSSAAGQRTLFAVGAGASPLLAVLAAVGLTGEYRHQTVTATFLATPRRSRVIIAKLITYAVVGAGYALACLAVTVAIALPWLATEHIHVPLDGHGIPATMAGVILLLAVYGLLGTGVGALIREQVATVVVLLLFLFVIGPVLSGIHALQTWTAFLPGAAADALTRYDETGRHHLQSWQAGLVLTGYGLVFAAAGIRFAIRRDVT